ncbi:MAG: peptidoglycan DD-metalloendopeptidase family protein [Pseudomonadota bacterium]
MRNGRFSKILPIVAVGFGLSACSNIGDTFANLDLDLRNTVGGLDTSNAARQATLDRPRPDERGVISYPNYQVAVARNGDTVPTIAARVGGDATEIARLNGLSDTTVLGRGEIVALPRSTPVPVTTGGTAPLDITQIATSAIDNAPATGGIAQAKPSRRIDGPEPVRHRVERGETAYSIARLYNVSVRSLADWNGLGPDLTVRQDQTLLVPVVDKSVTPTPAVATTQPGEGTATPAPPSASKPLPEPIEAVQKPATAEASPTPTAAPASAKFLKPVAGNILRPYKKRKNEGIDIQAAAGTQVKAAADGTVAAITRDTDQVPILVVRHTGNVLTVYANITSITVKKGDKVSRGQTLAKVGPGSPPFLHFEIREGFESVNPTKYLE